MNSQPAALGERAEHRAREGAPAAIRAERRAPRALPPLRLQREKSLDPLRPFDEACLQAVAFSEPASLTRPFLAAFLFQPGLESSGAAENQRRTPARVGFLEP